MALKRGELWIIPDEKQILNEEFHKEVYKGASHTDDVIRFAKEYDLPVQILTNDYHDGPCKIAQLGHLVVKTVEDMSLFILYLPDVLTERQYIWLLDHRYLFMQFVTIGAYSFTSNGWINLVGFNAIKNEFVSKYKRYKENQVSMGK